MTCGGVGVGPAVPRQVVISERRCGQTATKRGFYGHPSQCLALDRTAPVCAPAIARPEGLLRLARALTAADVGGRGWCCFGYDNCYYGYVDRFAINALYATGELRGDALIHVIGHGVLGHISPRQLAYDIARWGLRVLSPTARAERAAFYGYDRPLSEFYGRDRPLSPPRCASAYRGTAKGPLTSVRLEAANLKSRATSFRNSDRIS